MLDHSNDISIHGYDVNNVSWSDADVGTLTHASIWSQTNPSRWERFLLFLIGKPRYSSIHHASFNLDPDEKSGPQEGSFYIRLHTEV